MLIFDRENECPILYPCATPMKKRSSLSWADPKPTINKGNSSSSSSFNLISWVFPLEKLCNLVLEKRQKGPENDVLKEGGSGSGGGKKVRKTVTGGVRHRHHRLYRDHRRRGQLNQRISFCVCILCVTWSVPNNEQLTPYCPLFFSSSSPAHIISCFLIAKR